MALTHPEQAQALADEAYVAYVRRSRNDRKALDYAQAEIYRLASARDFNWNDEIMLGLATRIEHLRRGYSLRNECSGTCDCPGERTYHFRGRCVGCGAGLAPEFLAIRADVEKPDIPPSEQRTDAKVAYLLERGREAEADRVKFGGNQ